VSVVCENPSFSRVRRRAVRLALQYLLPITYADRRKGVTQLLRRARCLGYFQQPSATSLRGRFRDYSNANLHMDLNIVGGNDRVLVDVDELLSTSRATTRLSERLGYISWYIVIATVPAMNKLRVFLIPPVILSLAQPSIAMGGNIVGNNSGSTVSKGL
jgi:hypothetical protein